MGYTTEFEGSFKIVGKPMEKKHIDYLNKFSETRRMKRNPYIAKTLPDPMRDAVGLPIGIDGGYFVGGAGYCGQDSDESIVNSNTPPADQPSLWNQWVVSEDGTRIEWDGGEKFYSYIEWIKYIINHFLTPWGYTIEGVVRWYGEDREDIGAIEIENNVVHTS